MNVLIDVEDMIILRKMQDQTTLTKLSNIEVPHKHVAIIYADGPSDFNNFTDMQLKLLIRNSAGPDVKHVFSTGTLTKILFGMVQALPMFEAKAFEVDLQLRAIPAGDDRPYKYVPGAFAPQLVEEGLDSLVPLQYSGAGDALNVPASAPQHAPQGTVAGPAAQAPARAPAAAGGDDFSPPKPGTSTHEIFTYCAQEWKAAGYTEDKRTLDEIRKRAVDQLVPRGLNVSTVRTQAMRWYQHRTRFAV